MGERATRLRSMCAVCVCALSIALSILDAKALAAPPDGSFVPAKDLAELEARLGKILENDGVPGMAAVIADRDGIVWTAGIGLADVAARTPATPDTLFRVASVSKTFVALAVLKLAKEGRLDLDAPVKSLVRFSRRRRRLRPSCPAPMTAGTRRRIRAFRAWPGCSACVGSPA